VSALELRGVCKAFGTTLALDAVDLRIAPGELMTLLGPSGSGKTTLLNLVAGFETPNAGAVMLRGRDVARMTPAERGVGMVFQDYALFPHMTVAENVGYGLKARRRPRAERERRVAEVLELLRLGGYGERYPRQLSGGEQQRVALGRALAYDPQVVLMDEPLGALDRSLRVEMEEEIRRIHRDLGPTILYVTHDQQEALALADRVAVMRAGRIVGVGTPEELYRRPPNGFVAGFFANANLLPVESYALGPDGRAAVRCAGQSVEVPAPASPNGAATLAVRRRSLRREPAPGGLALRGTVVEALLLGDERRVTLEVPGVGRVVALLDTRDSGDMTPAAATELHVPAAEAVLVPEGAG
jgi:ABC-type Fe3+/spermidine/putrescine transport system ATPase subunit